ncbi:hypothetical protein Tco_0602413 [Tanacetum coccineum]
MDDPNITMEEYIRLEEEKARRHDFKNEFLAIVYNDAQTSKSDLLTKPILSPQHIDEFNLKDETSLSECDEEEQNVLNFNDLFHFNVIYPNDSKSDKDNDDDKVDIEHSSGNLFVKPLPDVGAYAQGPNNLLETSHDKSNKFFKVETFIKDLNVNIMTWNHLNKRMSFNFLIKNLNEDVDQERHLIRGGSEQSHVSIPSLRVCMCGLCRPPGILQKARIMELERRYFEDYYSDNQYAVSIKEDTAGSWKECEVEECLMGLEWEELMRDLALAWEGLKKTLVTLGLE